jgi:hypothetical protein
VRIEKPFGDTIGIFLVIDMLMMAAMFTGPEKNRVLKRAGAKNHRKKPDHPMSPEG